eukprot:TRINITY_DN33650_c0_g1_i2.p1 TRINITY_DN33650_c0_g1~~TRINITY_DN33650_c0_g1_i2.p1  ORF type:complete len:279 (+),score=28.95 TRINITY_DN33650_c0_g1_i2:187-1023(+)
MVEPLHPPPPTESESHHSTAGMQTTPGAEVEVVGEGAWSESDGLRGTVLGQESPGGRFAVRLALRGGLVVSLPPRRLAPAGGGVDGFAVGQCVAPRSPGSRERGRVVGFRRGLLLCEFPGERLGVFPVRPSDVVPLSPPPVSPSPRSGSGHHGGGHCNATPPLRSAGGWEQWLTHRERQLLLGQNPPRGSPRRPLPGSRRRQRSAPPHRPKAAAADRGASAPQSAAGLYDGLPPPGSLSDSETALPSGVNSPPATPAIARSGGWWSPPPDGGCYLVAT